MLNVDRVADALRAAPAPATTAASPRARAGVAIVLAGPRGSPSMCFMRRAARAGDRWSGDIALPGGWARADEGPLRATAMRETHEEVGIVLTEAHHLGDVPPLAISRHGRDGGGIVAASVFYVGGVFPHVTPDAAEVADVFWVACEDLYAASNRTTVRWSRSGPPLPRPAVDVGGGVVWGLTYRILARFSTLVLGAGSPLEADAEPAPR